MTERMTRQRRRSCGTWSGPHAVPHPQGRHPRPQPARAPVTLDELALAVGSRLGLVPRATQRVVAAPGFGGLPFWVDDPGRSRRHLDERRCRARRPASSTSSTAGWRAASPRDRSPWAMTLVHGLEGGRQAVVVRVHHAITDGSARSTPCSPARASCRAPPSTRPTRDRRRRSSPAAAGTAARRLDPHLAARPACSARPPRARREPSARITQTFPPSWASAATAQRRPGADAHLRLRQPRARHHAGRRQGDRGDGQRRPPRGDRRRDPGRARRTGRGRRRADASPCSASRPTSRASAGRKLHHPDDRALAAIWPIRSSASGHGPELPGAASCARPASTSTRRLGATRPGS